MASEPPLDSVHQNRLMRYIHTGMEVPKYFPGCWSAHGYYEADKLKAIDEALQQNANNVGIINLIVKAYKDGWYTRYETIAFALCKCLLVGGQSVKEAGYKAVSEICNTPEELMLFTKFTRILKTGNGQGWCKSVRNWYLHKNPLELAKEMTRVRARYGRSHKTLIRKSHVKIDDNDNARQAVIKYSIFGLKRAKQMLADKEGTAEIFDYIEKVEALRCCEDPKAAAVMAAANNFTLDHIPGHLLTSQEVWEAVMPQCSLRELLGHIQRIHNMGYLSDNSSTTAIILSILNNKDIIEKSNVTPLEVYITLCDYKKKCRPLKFLKAKVTMEREQRRRTKQIFDHETNLWEWNVSRRHPREAKIWGIDEPPNQAIVGALTKLIDHTWLLTAATGASYFITMDMRNHMFKGRHFCKSLSIPNKSKKAMKAKAANPEPAVAETGGGGDADNAEKPSKKHLYAECFHNKHVTPGHVAIILALQILKREKNVKIAVFTEQGVKLVGKKWASIEEAETDLRNKDLGRVQLDAPIKFAKQKKHKVDVFINMVDRTTRFTELDPKDRGGRGPAGRYGNPPVDPNVVDHCPVRALKSYRETGVKDAKLVVMSLASHRVATTDGNDEGVLDVVGIDEHVPKLIDAFVLGQFK